jgi:DNA polymerase-3 subunit alpha
VGFFVSGHPLGRFAAEVGLFASHTTDQLGQWVEGPVQVAAVVTGIKRQIARRSGAEWAKVTLEDFHGSAEALVFPEAWKKLSGVLQTDGSYLVTGGYSLRDRGEEDAPFIVEDAQPLADFRVNGRVALALRWARRDAVPPETMQAAAAVCRAHPGNAPVMIEWQDDNGAGTARFRARGLQVALDDELIHALEGVVGSGRVELVKAG